ncbi:hypothetical protein CDAR_498621 [Caerostris darwini]|uniref:Uncharacterized protein n=1 Tax=Caerostris darwini TaxID=1538125 RepID=A0AAV4SMI4_9ARAC|nr:hypothetical protein CDAR_498621 [Caerostris darwini]
MFQTITGGKISFIVGTHIITSIYNPNESERERASFTKNALFDTNRKMLPPLIFVEHLGFFQISILNVPAEAIKHILCQNHHNRHYVQAANVSFITAFRPLSTLAA